MGASEQQAIFDHGLYSIPRWLTRGKTAALEWLHGFAVIYEAARTQIEEWLEQSYIATATGRYLDQHALDRNTYRRAGESDASLRVRLRSINDAVTVPALESVINSILATSALDPCAIIVLRRDRAHYQDQGDSTAFYSRGYRRYRNTRPAEYVIILPFGSTTIDAAAVAEFVRQYGPGGFRATIERRTSP